LLQRYTFPNKDAEQAIKGSCCRAKLLLVLPDDKLRVGLESGEERGIFCSGCWHSIDRPSNSRVCGIITALGEHLLVETGVSWDTENKEHVEES